VILFVCIFFCFYIYFVVRLDEHNAAFSVCLDDLYYFRFINFIFFQVFYIFINDNIRFLFLFSCVVVLIICTISFILCDYFLECFVKSCCGYFDSIF